MSNPANDFLVSCAEIAEAQAEAAERERDLWRARADVWRARSTAWRRTALVVCALQILTAAAVIAGAVLRATNRDASASHNPAITEQSK